MHLSAVPTLQLWTILDPENLYHYLLKAREGSSWSENLIHQARKDMLTNDIWKWDDQKPFTTNNEGINFIHT